MGPDLQSTLLKLALPAGIVALVLVVAKKRGIRWGEDLRLTWPQPSHLILWMALWVGWVALGELAIRVFDMPQPAPWKAYGPLVLVLRVVAIGVLGPASEELLMRGLLFFRLSRTRLGPTGAIVICAAAWAAMHFGYDWKTITMILLDGIVLGIGRQHTCSVTTPILLHASGNLFSIWQSLHP